MRKLGFFADYPLESLNPTARREEMKRSPPAFNKTESSILIALYEKPSAAYTSYTLAKTLNPATQMGTPDYGVAWTNTREATEELIVQGLVRGERLECADGIYFNDLELTTKGEKAAIQERRRIAEFEKALPQIIKDANAVAEEMEKSKEKK
jgi:hypothetical protein